MTTKLTLMTNVLWQNSFAYKCDVIAKLLCLGTKLEQMAKLLCTGTKVLNMPFLSLRQSINPQLILKKLSSLLSSLIYLVYQVYQVCPSKGRGATPPLSLLNVRTNFQGKLSNKSILTSTTTIE